MITLTATGALAEAYRKINPECYIHSFRKLQDKEIGQILSSTDILIHNSAGKKEEDAGSNIELTKRIVYLCLKNKPEIKFINIGSMSYLNESGYMPVKKMSFYGYSKFIGETYCLATMRNIKSVRFPTIFCKDPEKDILSKLINEAVFRKKMILINGGMNKRDYLPIDIAARELHRIAMTNTENIITVASGRELTFLQVARIIQKYTTCNIEFRLGKTVQVLSKFEKTVEVNIEDEIYKYIKYLKSA